MPKTNSKFHWRNTRRKEKGKARNMKESMHQRIKNVHVLWRNPVLSFLLASQPGPGWAPLQTTDSSPTSSCLIKTTPHRFSPHLSVSQAFYSDLEKFFSPHLVAICGTSPYMWFVRWVIHDSSSRSQSSKCFALNSEAWAQLSRTGFNTIIFTRRSYLFY